MKLLFDQNLSPSLVARLGDIYPGSVHVFSAGMDRSSDKVLWNYAREHGLTIVTQDVDFSEMSDVMGFPPKVIWIRRGNCSTHQIENILREQHEAIRDLENDNTAGVLTLL